MSGETSKSDRIKLLVAVVALVGSGVWLAYYLGAFDKWVSKPPPAPVLTDEQQKDFEKTQKEMKKKVETGEIPPPAGA